MDESRFMQVNTLFVILISCLLISCTGVKVGANGQEVLVKPEKPFCDTQKVDPNCKINRKNYKAQN
mgnify:CR=1 FL=1